MDYVARIFHDFLVLFAMVNAIGNLPVFADLTSDMPQQERSKTFLLAIIVGGSIVLVFSLAGDVLLRYVFNVDTASFKVAGGILVFLVAAKVVISGTSSVKAQANADGPVAVFPLGFPYLAGPGTILTTMILIQSDGRVMAAVTTVLVYSFIFPVLHLAPYVERAIGKIGVMVVSRILNIFICAKAVSFVLSGLQVATTLNPF